MNNLLRSPVFSGGYQCKGTYKLGSACGECEKCKLEIASISSADINRAFSAQNDYESLKVMLNTPELTHFDRGIITESDHQIQKWGSQHDAGKTHPDWFWLVGYLAGKALSAMMTGERDKALHHTISTAAVLRNWHRHILTGNTFMRPGTEHKHKWMGDLTGEAICCENPKCNAMFADGDPEPTSPCPEPYPKV